MVRDARIALGCLAPTIVRATSAERFLRGKTLDVATRREAARLALDDASPIDDVRGSKEYRATTLAVFIEDGLARIADSRHADGLLDPPVLLETGETVSVPHSAFDGTIETTINGAPARLERRAT